MRSFCKKSGFAVRICGKTTVARVAAAALVWAGVMLTAGCQRLIDGPKLNEADQVRPDKIVSFDTLYGENCAGCHGANGKNGSAIPMNNPEYMAFATDARQRADGNAHARFCAKRGRPAD
jgi:mono/diheme cytochrome c family protein